MSQDNGTLAFAHARVDITPPLGIPMGGYAGRGTTGCSAVEERLLCDILLLEQGDSRFVLAAMDLIAIDEEWAGGLRARIARDLGAPESHVVFSASHTHFGPESRRRNAAPWTAQHVAWLEEMNERVAEAARNAVRHAAPCSMRVGEADVGDFMYNRRLIRRDGTCRTVFRLPLPDEELAFGPVDPRLTVLRLDREDGGPGALAASIGIHPVVGGADFYAISPDYPGVLRQTVEAVYGAPALFLLGTAGNVVPIRRGAGERLRIGRALAGAAITAAERSRHVKGPLTVAEERIEVPRAASHPIYGSPVRLEVTALGVGELGVVFLPGEIFAETGLYLKTRSPFPHTLVVSLANQAVGYIPTRTAFMQGGYEVEHARTTHGMTEEAEPLLTDAAVRALVRAWEAGALRPPADAQTKPQ